MQSRRGALSGVRLTLTLAILLSAAFLTQIARLGSGEEGLRAVIRLSARTSVALFCAAFAASSLRLPWRAPVSMWLVSERRSLGLAFAYSHLVHLLALVALGQVSQEFVDGLSAVTLVGGGGAYVFLLLMAATSNDAAVRALGMRRWSWLHTIGGYYLWIIFFQSYAPRAFRVSPAYALPTLLLAATMGLRFTAWRQARRP